MTRARNILRHAKAVRSIRTVTSTMKMIATARFKVAHGHLTATKPYMDRMALLVSDVVSRGGVSELRHPLLLGNGVPRDVLLVITANRGLCGGYNSGVLKITTERRQQLIEHGYEVLLHVVGKRGIAAARRMNLEAARSYAETEYMPAYPVVRDMADELMDDFIAGRIGGLEVAYMQFVSPTRQRPVIAPVLPLTEFTAPPRLVAAAKAVTPPPYELVPSSQEVFQRLLPLTVRLKLYQCFVDAAASEQVMRVAAMTAATDNADEMIRDLTVQYNRQRQSQITTELAEIMGGRMGLQEAE